MQTQQEYHDALDSVAAAVDAQFGVHNPDHVAAAKTFIDVVKDRIEHLFGYPRIVSHQDLPEADREEITQKQHLAAQVAEHATIVNAAPAAPTEEQ